MEFSNGTCALVAASDFNGAYFSRCLKAGRFGAVIAVDGGYAHVRSAGCAPDLVIGDFDSLGYVPAGERVLEYPAHKDKSDLEIAFDYASEKGFAEVMVFGALGGRLDHTVANLQMCARFAEEGMDVRLIGADFALSILVGPGVLDVSARESGTVSVFSAVAESRGVSEKGMEYPLDGATLSNRTTLGLSNELVGQPASVSVEEGTLFVFHPIPL